MRIHFQLFAVAQLASFGDAFVIPRRAPIALFRPQISMSKPNPPDGPPPEDLLEPNLPFYLEEPDVEEEVKSEVVEAQTVEASVDEVVGTPEEDEQDEPDEEESVQEKEKTSDESKEKEEVTLNEIVKAETVEASADEVVDTPEEDERDEEESVQEEEKTPDEESKEKEEVTLNETDEAFAEAINDFQQRAAARIRLTSWWLEDVLRPIREGELEPGVPQNEVAGAALTASALAFLVSQGLVVAGAAGLGAAYVALTKGSPGETIRTVGGMAYGVTETIISQLREATTNDELSDKSKVLAEKLLNAILESTNGGESLREPPKNEPIEDIEKVLKEAEEAVSAADEEIAKATGSLVEEEEDVEDEIEEDNPSSFFEDSVEEVVVDAVEDIGKVLKEAEEAVSEADEEIAKVTESLVQEEEDVEDEIEGDDSSSFFEDSVEEVVVDAVDEEDLPIDSIDDEVEEEEWRIAVEMAQKGIEGKIVGIDESITDDDAKADWDAAGLLAQELENAGFVEEDEPNIAFDEEDGEDEVDMEAIARAAREAVEAYEAMQQDPTPAAPADEEVEEQSSSFEWSSLTVKELREELQSRGLKPYGKKAELVVMLEESDAAGDDAQMDDVSGSDDDLDDEIDLEELGRQARAAVEIFEAEGSGVVDLTADEPSDEALLELENQLLDDSEDSNRSNNDDFESLTVAQLKDELRSRGLRLSGKKAELIERLRSSS